MRKKLMLGIAVGTMLALGGAGGAFAGEIGGNGQGTQGPAHARSECSFSGLEDGSEDPDAPSGPGTTQNWGHSKQFAAEIGATGHGAAVVTIDTPDGPISFGCNANQFPMK